MTKTVCLIVSLFFFQVLYGQQQQLFVDSIMESSNDSTDLANGFYNLYDTPAFDLYKSWNTSRLKYISPDSTRLDIDLYLNLDSTLIVLHDSLRNYSMPINSKRVTSGFGNRYYRFHYGTDLDLMTGDSVMAVFDGQVRYAAYYRGYGYTIVVRHYNGLETIYSHLSKILADTNQYVKAGDLIGYGGSTGRSTGSHLHFETRYLGAAFDSEELFCYKNGSLKSDTFWLSAGNFSYLGPVRDKRLATYHYIKSGDTLGRIARLYGTNIGSLCRLNGISRSTILRIGKKLRIR